MRRAMTETETLEDLTGRLERAADRLRNGELDAEAAAALVEACAHDAGRAATELDRLFRVAAQDQPLAAHGQPSLL